MAAELQQYWSGSLFTANLFIGANLAGALLLCMLLGVGFYPAALLLAALCMAVMVFVNGLESWLPGRSVLEITVSFTPGHRPDFDEINAGAQERGYRLQRDSLSITFADSRPVWKFAAVAIERSRAMSPAKLAEGLSTLEGIASFGIVPVRN